MMRARKTRQSEQIEEREKKREEQTVKRESSFLKVTH